MAVWCFSMLVAGGAGAGGSDRLRRRDSARPRRTRRAPGAFERLQPLDHCLDAGTRLLVAGHQGGPLAGQLVAAASQAGIFLGEASQSVQRLVQRA
jgi:hypothetical protein